MGLTMVTWRHRDISCTFSNMACFASTTSETASSSSQNTVEAASGGSSAYSPPNLVGVLLDASERSRPLGVEAVFSALARDPVFMNELWQKKPFLCDVSLPSIAGHFTLDDVQAAVDADFVEAGRGTFSEGSSGWRMAQVSQPRGKSFEDAKLRFEEVQQALREKSGTVVVNSAGAYMRPLAGVCLEAVEALDMPVCLNLYITAAGQRTSAPPHTDKQDVFVMQTQGRKRWRVFSPPPPQAKPKADPMARGKGSDVLSLDELIGDGKEGALLDVVLEPGQLLYVPAGFPHTTDTVTNMEDQTDPSVHLTIGVDTHIWGLNYATLRSYALTRSGRTDQLKAKEPPEKAFGEGEYWRLFSALPLGFLGESIVSGYSRWSEMKQAQVTEMIAYMARLERDSQPGRWEESVPDDEVFGGEQTGEVARRLLDHHAQVTRMFKEMYGDVSYGLTEVPRDSCFLRSRPHLALIEETMSQLVRWGLTTTIAGPSDGPGGAALEGETATPTTSAGFGAVGTGGGTPARKGAPAKKKKSKKK
ncbi:unnamed protein product [Ascophyllum nodosum]